MTTLTCITPLDIAIAATVDDLDLALKPLMDIADITSGDCASVLFSGVDWKALDHTERLDHLYAWIEAERAYEDADEPPCRQHRDTGRGVCADCGAPL